MAKRDEHTLDFRHRFLGARNGVRFAARMNFSSIRFSFFVVTPKPEAHAAFLGRRHRRRLYLRDVDSALC